MTCEAKCDCGEEQCLRSHPIRKEDISEHLVEIEREVTDEDKELLKLQLRNLQATPSEDVTKTVAVVI